MKSIIKKFLQPVFNTPVGRRIKYQLELNSFVSRRLALKQELAKLSILHSGVEDVNGQRLPFVVLEDKTILYGRFPTGMERDVYAKWKEQISPEISEDTLRVAMDVIMRYCYPHALPHLTMPYSRSQRKHFHYQHIETIKDLPGWSDSQKDELITLFKVEKGESFLDVGAYMGFGDVRMSREIGTNGRIVAVEADEKARSLLELNLSANNISNVTIIPAAVSDHDGFETFYRTERQANSLISDVVSSDNSCQVETLSIDSILRRTSMPSVNRISLTINGAEVEAIDGMQSTVENNKFLRISAAGWYRRNGQRISTIIAPKLRAYGLQVAVGRDGGVLAWKQFKGE
jgi:FkbM family methyltransferase